MFTRIVQLTFQEDKVPQFLENFEKNKHAIRGFEGCKLLKLLRDKNDPNKFFTYSKWESEEDLQNYRNSNLFKGIWANTKIHFSDKPQAWSVDEMEVLK